MRQANASGAAYGLLIGDNELAGGFVTVKDLQAGGMETERKQTEIKREEIVAFLKHHKGSSDQANHV
jgi:histidyl-tRNA synthetase